MASPEKHEVVSLPPLFSPLSVRKQEYWQFAKLIAPQPELPEGKRAWTADDATGIWCLKCSRRLVYQKGSSQSIRYHMETKHLDELLAFRENKKHQQQHQHQQPAALSTDPSVVSSSSPSATAKAETCAAATTTTSVEETNGKLKASSSSSSSSIEPSEPHEPPSDAPHSGEEATEEDTLNASPSQRTSCHKRHKSTSSNKTANTKPEMSWTRNLQRQGGFWGDAAWYDLHLTRRMPLVKTMLEELIAALPPCNGKRVLDLCAGSGRASAALLDAYPEAQVTLLDSSQERLDLARGMLEKQTQQKGSIQYLHSSVNVEEMQSLPGGPYDVVIGTLAFHVLVEKPAHYGRGKGHNSPSEMSHKSAYWNLFHLVLKSLNDGGHLIFGDHVGMLPLFQQLYILNHVGFEDVDCAWRQNEFFVAGGMKKAEEDDELS